MTLLPPGYLDHVREQIAARLAEGDLSAVSLTWYHLAGATIADVNPYGSPELAKTSTPETVEGWSGSLRDSLTGDVTVGRYRYLVPVAEFTSGDPDVDDQVGDGEAVQVVTSVQKDHLGLFWLIGVAEPTTEG